MTGDPWSFNGPYATWVNPYPPCYVPEYRQPPPYYPPTQPVPTATPVHPLVGKTVRVVWKEDETEFDYVVLDLVGGMVKLGTVADDKSPIWSPISDIHTLQEMTDVNRG
jgi:hypothetical protein